jgi:hypothetical protein
MDRRRTRVVTMAGLRDVGGREVEVGREVGEEERYLQEEKVSLNSFNSRRAVGEEGAAGLQ